MVDELVHYDESSGVATVTLDSPHNRNALSARLRGELTVALTTATESSTVRVVVLTHTGPVFCAGMDLKEARGAEAADQGVNEFPRILTQIWTSPKPVVARLAGPARAGGVGMVAAADIAVAAAEATFAFSEVRIGVAPALISLLVRARLTPRAAQELMLTGRTFDAAHAAATGLINDAVPADELDSTVNGYVSALTKGGPTALATTKELLSGELGARMPAEFARLHELSARLFSGAEGQEGITAFVQKRKPSWIPSDG